jgi:hypothetical protein
VDSLVDIVRRQKPTEKIWMGFDEALRSQLLAWARLYVQQKERYPEIVGFGFAPVYEVEALQGADLIAYESYSHAIKYFRLGPNAEPHAHFAEFMWRDLSGAVAMDRAMILEMAERVKIQSGRL